MNLTNSADNSVNKFRRWRIPYQCILNQIFISVDEEDDTNDYEVRIYKNGIYLAYLLFDDSDGDFDDGDVDKSSSSLVYQEYDAGDYISFTVESSSNDNHEVMVIPSFRTYEVS